MSLFAPRTFVLVLVTLLATVAPAAGEKRKSSQAEAEAEAHAHYQRALSYYNLREYGIAVLEFKEAYAISNQPLLLFNIGQAYRLDRQYEEALHYYRTFLQLRPRAPNRRDVEQFIAEMEHMMKTEPPLGRDEGNTPSAESAPDEPTVLPTPPGETPVPQPAAPPTPATTATVKPPPPSLVPGPSPPQKKPLSKRWWVWTAAGAGVAAIGVGLGVGLTLGRPIQRSP